MMLLGVFLIISIAPDCFTSVQYNLYYFKLNIYFLTASRVPLILPNVIVTASTLSWITLQNCFLSHMM